MNKIFKIIVISAFTLFAQIGDWDNSNNIFSLLPSAEANFRTSDANTGYANLYNGEKAGSLITASLTNFATGYGYKARTAIVEAHYLFDGVNDEINLGLFNGFDNLTEFTLSVNFMLNNTTGTQYLIFQQVNGTNHVSLAIAGNAIYVQVRNGDTSYGSVSTIGVIDSGKSYHIHMVFDGSGALNADRLKLFIDDSEHALSFTGTIPASTATLSSIQAVISASSFPINGKVSELSLYNKAQPQTWRTQDCQLGSTKGGLLGIDNGDGTMDLIYPSAVNLHKNRYFRFGASFPEWSKRKLRY